MEAGTNSSLDMDLGLARRMMQSQGWARGGQDSALAAAGAQQPPKAAAECWPEAPPSSSTRPLSHRGPREPTPRRPCQDKRPLQALLHVDPTLRSVTPGVAIGQTAGGRQRYPLRSSLSAKPLRGTGGGGATSSAPAGTEASRGCRGAGPEDPARAKLIRWCFRHSREQIEERLLWLDKASFSSAHREKVYVARGSVPAANSQVGQLWRLYQQAGLTSLPRMSDQSNLEGWAAQEGGCSRTSEALTAFEVLNFHRWLCGAPRLQLDSFRQELADMVLQCLSTRNVQVPKDGGQPGPRRLPHAIGLGCHEGLACGPAQR